MEEQQQAINVSVAHTPIDQPPSPTADEIMQSDELDGGAIKFGLAAPDTENPAAASAPAILVGEQGGAEASDGFRHQLVEQSSQEELLSCLSEEICVSQCEEKAGASADIMFVGERGGAEASEVFVHRPVEQSAQEELLYSAGEDVGAPLSEERAGEIPGPASADTIHIGEPGGAEASDVFGHQPIQQLCQEELLSSAGDDVCAPQSEERGSETPASADTVLIGEQSGAEASNVFMHQPVEKPGQNELLSSAEEDVDASQSEQRVGETPAAATIPIGEQGGAEASDFYRQQLVEESVQEELSSAQEEVAAPQCEERVGEARETDDEKATAFEHCTTTASTVPMDETLESEEAGVPECKGDQDMDDVLFHGFPSFAPSALAEEDGKAPPLEPGSPVVATSDDTAVDADQMDVEESEEPMAESAGRGRGRGRRKRGRPPKAQATPIPAKRRKEKEKEKADEEVCFICFDGGDLVLCDRKGCPKVYHPSCVNRDEAFFRAKGRWNCGWHICSNCQKSAHYMCYTCTFSLCKLCINEAGFVRVRENKGFCATCMSTVILIESRVNKNKQTGEIDFDDKSSWMYLFKDYWLDLKAKLSLTLEELTRAKTPRKNSNAISCAKSFEDLDTVNDVKEDSSDSISGRVKVNISSKKKSKKRARNIAHEKSPVKEAESEGTSISEDVGWASKELLEFVAHMKDGDKSPLSQFDVQALLLEYIKLNNLRDPRAKSQIICDLRLQNLFGKTRVGHFEMLKLLESHFLTKVHSPVVTDDNQGGVSDPDPSQMDTEGNSDASTRMSSDRRRRSRKRLQEKEPQTNLDDYAAIDVHNITLMYLRRNLMEDLIDDIDTFSEKVVGAFVRIRISGSGVGQHMYRLVQIVGTGKAAKKYRTGKKNTDFTLEILNLSKTEFITIDIISNQEFTEEECKRLRQSIKCGFIGRLTVGEVQEKALVLRAVRVNDWLESEKLRIGNLRDRASEKGRRKELRECVEKLFLLSTPEERVRRLNEVPDIHADPKMDPDYESSEDEEDLDDVKQDNSDHSRESFFLRRGNDGISSGKGGSISSNNWNSVRKSADTGWEPKRNIPAESSWDIGSSTSTGNRTNQSCFSQEEQVHQTSSSQALNVRKNAGDLEAGVSSNNQLVTKSGQSSVVPSEITSASSLAMSVVPSNTNETEKMWHYQDPSGKVQGPFSITQLRKWNNTGLFPASLGIWRTSEKQEDSILLTDALNGKFQKDLPQLQPQYNSTAQPAMVATMMDAKGKESDGGWKGKNDNTWTNNNQNAVNWKASHNDAGLSSTGNNESMRTDMWAAQSSAWSAPKPELVSPKGGRVGISSGGWQSSNVNNAWSGQPQGPNSMRPVSPFPGNPNRSSSYQGRGRGRWNGGQDRRNSWNPNKTRVLQPGNQGYERHPNWNNSHQQSSVGYSNNLPANNTANQLRHDSFNLPTPQPGRTDVPGSFNSFPSTALVQPVNARWDITPRGTGAEILQKSSPDEHKNASDPNAPSSSGFQNGEMASGSVSMEFRSVLDENKSSGRTCPNANTRCEQGPSDVRAPSQLNEGQNCKFVSDISVAENITVSDAQPPTVQNLCVNDIKPTVASESVSVHGSVISSDHKQEPDGSSANPACATGPAQLSNSVMGVASQIPTTAAVPTQANSSMILGAAIQGNGNAEWGAVTQGNMNVVWGIPAQGNANMSIGWGTPVQSNPNAASTGWGAPAQGDISANMEWGTPTQGNVNQNASWAAQAQGNSALNPSSGVPTQGNMNQNVNWGMPPPQGSANANAGWATAGQGNAALNPSCGGLTQGNMNQSVSWGMPPPQQGNANANAGWTVAGQGNTNPAWNHSGLSAQQNQMGDGSSSRPPMNGQSGGVCRFHESGYCRKGAHCNYFHQ